MSPTPPSVAHLGIAVADLEEAQRFYRDILGLTPAPLGTADGAEIVSVHVGDVEIELLAPRTTDGPIAKFLARRGPGIHHVCYAVPDLDAALDACRRHGYQLVDDTPRTGAHGRRIAFVHPRATGGILLELTEAGG